MPEYMQVLSYVDMGQPIRKFNSSSPFLGT
jgi:hypothetical protein